MKVWAVFEDNKWGPGLLVAVHSNEDSAYGAASIAYSRKENLDLRSPNAYVVREVEMDQPVRFTAYGDAVIYNS